MTVWLIQALEAIDARKDAGGIGADVADFDDAPGLMLGFDLDRRELGFVADEVARQALGHIVGGHGALQIVRGVFADGVLAGLMLAQLRREEEVRERA